ncbi:Asp-tRNA(Asn)/Glu-tRNA(Gln) amidotransferase subunit GatC [Candidatus Margulisiibacteriota bacterium]
MAISKKDVDHVAKLARLGLTEVEKDLFAGQLSKILEHAETINKLDTEKVPPTSHALPMKNVLREDKVKGCEDVKSIISNAPEEEDNMFSVPRILE